MPSGAQTHINKACDGMSAREVWSRAGSRATALYGDARTPTLFAAVPNSPAGESPAFPHPSPRLFLLLLTNSRLHLLRCNQLLLLLFFLFRHLVPGPPQGFTGRQMSPKKQETTRTCEDNPRLKRTLTENCLFFKVYKYFSITRRHFLAL